MLIVFVKRPISSPYRL